MPRDRSLVTGTLSAVVAATLFGMLGPLARFGEAYGIEGVAFVAWRALLGLVCIGTLLVARRGVGEAVRAVAGLSRRGRLSLLLASAMGLALNLAMFSAFGLIPIALALMLFYTYPAGVAVVDVAMGHERITAARLAALGLSTLGVALVLVGGLNPGDGASVQRLEPLGIVLGLTAAAAQVVFVTVSRHGYRSVPTDGATFVNIGASLIGATLVALAVGQANGLAAPLRSLDPWPVILVAGIAAAGLSSLLFLGAIRLIGGTRTGILMLLEPVVGVVLAALWLGEALGPLQLAGGALVLLGALVLQLGSEPDHEPVVEAAAGPVV
jgi:drug/metabolite transporter (DMT)-like permease